MPPKEGEQADTSPAPEGGAAPLSTEPNVPKELGLTPEAANQDAFTENSNAEQAPETPVSMENFDERWDAFSTAIQGRQNGEISNIGKEKPGLFEQARSRYETVGNWYNKSLTPKQKILFGVGLGALGAGVAAVGVAGGIAGGVIGAAMMAKRFIGAAGTYAMLEAGMAKAYEKRGVERKDWQKKLGTAGALTLSALIGGGAVSEAVRNVMDYVGGDDVAAIAAEKVGGGSGGLATPEPLSHMHEGAAPGSALIPSVEIKEIPVELPEPHVEFEGIHEVHAGDNLTKIIQSKLLAGEEFRDLTAGQRENITANLIAKMKVDPASFGITSGDVGMLNVGENLDMTKMEELLQNTRVNGESLVAHAQHLGEAPASIVASMEPHMQEFPVHLEEPHVDIEVDTSEPTGIQPGHSLDSISSEDEITESILKPHGTIPTSEHSLPSAEISEREQFLSEHENLTDTQDMRKGEHYIELRSGKALSLGEMASDDLGERLAAKAIDERLSSTELEHYGRHARSLEALLRKNPLEHMTESTRLMVPGEKGINAAVNEIFMERKFNFSGNHATNLHEIVKEKAALTQEIKNLMRAHPDSFGLQTADLSALPENTALPTDKMRHALNILHQQYTEGSLESSQSVPLSAEHVAAVAQPELPPPAEAPVPLEVEQHVGTPIGASPEEVMTAAEAGKLDAMELKFYGVDAKNIELALQSDPHSPDSIPFEGDKTLSELIAKHSGGASPWRQLYLSSQLEELMQYHSQAFGFPTYDINKLPPGTTVSENKIRDLVHALGKMADHKKHP